MDRKQNEVQVGLITVFALVVLVIGMMWLKDMTVGGGVQNFEVDFPTVEGLQVGDRVQVRGIRAGQVDKFEVMDGFVRVGIELDDEIMLREDASFTLGTKGIVGEVVIEILTRRRGAGSGGLHLPGPHRGLHHRDDRRGGQGDGRDARIDDQAQRPGHGHQ